VKQELLMLFSHCIIVQGASRTAICDLQRNAIHFIPNSFASLFNEGRYLDLSRLDKDIAPASLPTLKEYIDFLYKHELGFSCKHKDKALFSPLSQEWIFPGHITNCILDAEKVLYYFNGTFCEQLASLCCNFIEVRFFDQPSLTHIQELFELINQTQIKSVELIIPGYDAGFQNNMIDIAKRNPKLSYVTFYGASENTQYRSGTAIIAKCTEIMTSAICCGVIAKNLFVVNIPHYTESLKYNTCLNKKLSIDIQGNIKNCPSMQQSFGNVADTALADAINKPGFKKYWNITKDQINVCKDCELRHICTDCRAYLEDPGNLHSKPLKCGYDPYTCSWEDWSTHPLKQQAIDFYGMRELFVRRG